MFLLLFPTDPRIFLIMVRGDHDWRKDSPFTPFRHIHCMFIQNNIQFLYLLIPLVLSVNPSINQLVNQSLGQPVNQSVGQSGNHPITLSHNEVSGLHLCWPSANTLSKPGKVLSASWRAKLTTYQRKEYPNLSKMQVISTRYSEINQICYG